MPPVIHATLLSMLNFFLSFTTHPPPPIKTSTYESKTGAEHPLRPATRPLITGKEMKEIK